MSSYTTKQGDTFDSVSRKKFGSAGQSTIIFMANPGVTEPIPVGTVLFIPPAVDPNPVRRKVPSTGADEAALMIDGTRFRFWSSLEVVSALDSLDSISFSAPFDAELPGAREAFRPCSYKPLTVFVGGETLFEGTMINALPDLDTGGKSVDVSGYSLPGVLGDCTPSPDSFPLQFDGLTLTQIAERLAAPFGVRVIAIGDSGLAFPEVAISPSALILPFLVDLAQQRGLILTSTWPGELLFYAPTVQGPAIARLRQGVAPLLSVKPDIRPQEYFSSVTAVSPAGMFTDGGIYTARNSRLQGVARPHTFEAKDVEPEELPGAVFAKAGRMFAGVATYSVEVSTWLDEFGELWAPGRMVTLHAHEAMVYREYEFMLGRVVFRATPTSKTATLSLIMPEAYSSAIPERMPWDD